MNAVDGMIVQQVVAFLTSQDGATFTLASITSKLKLDVAPVRKALAQLEERGVARRVQVDRVARFYIPTPAQIAAMQKALVPTWRPLQPRKHHAERIAAIRAERAAIPSKH